MRRKTSPMTHVRTSTRVLAAAFFFAVALCAGAAAADMDRILAAAMSDSKVPALGLLTMRHGRIAQVGVRGVKRLSGHDPVRETDVWLIGSDVQPLTATLIARLAGRGVPRGNKPLEKMLPNLAAKMRPEYRSVTLVQLLSHRG